MVSRFRQVERLFPSVAQLACSNSNKQQQRAATEQFQPQSCVDSTSLGQYYVHRPDDKVLMRSLQETNYINRADEQAGSQLCTGRYASCMRVGRRSVREVYNLLSDLYHHRRDLYHLPSRT
jgi:hypothetical protein